MIRKKWKFMQCVECFIVDWKFSEFSIEFQNHTSSYRALNTLLEHSLVTCNTSLSETHGQLNTPAKIDDSATRLQNLVMLHFTSAIRC